MVKVRFILLAGIILSLMYLSFAGAMAIDSCAVLDKKGEVYTIENDVSSAGTCFNAGADAVTLNCNGHKVTYSNSLAGNGILINNFDRVVVKDCVFVQGSSSSNSDAVRLQDSTGSVILSNTMNTIGEYSLGIWLEKAYGVSAANNKITTSGKNSNGIAVYLASSRNVLIENEINAVNGIGISIFDGASNQVARNKFSGSSVDVYVRDGTAGEYNLENSTLLVEDPNYGIINFKKPVSASGEDLTQDVGVMFNLANIDEEESFNDAFSEITLYRTDSLGLVKKEAWRNNALCPSSICKIISDKDSFKLNATTHGRYSVGFNNNTGGNEGGGDGGGGGGGDGGTNETYNNQTGNNTDFVIAPPTIVPLDDYYAAFEIIGASLTRGIWYPMPETLRIRIGNETFEPWGDYQSPITSNVNDGNNPRFFYGAEKYSAGTPVSIDAKAWKKRKLYYDGRNNEHWMVFSECNLTEDVGRVRILKNGDAVPITKGGAFDQRGVKEYLERFVSSDGKIILGSNQAIFLFEMGEANYNSQASDWQDLVVLATISDSAITPPAVTSGAGLMGYLVKNLGESNAASIGALLILAAVVYIVIVLFKRLLFSK